MAQANEDPDLFLPAEFDDLPLKALRPTARNKIGQYLNLEGTVVVCVDDRGNEIDVSTNYNGLAELAGFDYLEIRNLARHRDPTQELLDNWTNREGYNANATVGYLWKYLRLMEREDVLKDCRRVILSDCQHYKEYLQIKHDAEKCDLYPVQDPTVSSGDDEMQIDETTMATTDDLHNALLGNTERVIYDAFVSYSMEDYDDRQFIRRMIAELEDRRGLRLFVPGRNDIPGAAQNSINAFLIEKRCRRVVILLSRAFLRSAVCDFQLKFAQCLAPGARSKRLIPVMRERDTPTPRILKFLAVCDFTKSDMVDWVWDRLDAAIKAPMGRRFTDSSVELEESLKEVRFPMYQQRLNSDCDRNSSSSQSEQNRRPSAPGGATSSSGSIMGRSEAITNRRVASFSGHPSGDMFESGTQNNSGPPFVFPSSSGARASQPIPITGRRHFGQSKSASPTLLPSGFSDARITLSPSTSNGRATSESYPRARFSPQQGEVTVEYSQPSQLELMEMSMEVGQEM